MPELPSYFMRRVGKSPSGCWYWQGQVDPHGYGRYNVGASKTLDRPARNWTAHRFAYEHVNGPLPRKGEPGHLQIDHECHNRSKSCKGGPTCLHRRCVNPAHLVAKTPRDNTGSSAWTTASINAAKTHCPRGHELAGDNLRMREGKRYCYTCHLESGSEARRQRLAEERGEGWERRYWQDEVTRCPQGHPYSGDNLYVAPNGQRGCKTCRAARARAHREKSIKGTVPRGNRDEWTCCPRGHELSGDNLYIAPKSGKRACKTCRRESARRVGARGEGRDTG